MIDTGIKLDSLSVFVYNNLSTENGGAEMEVRDAVAAVLRETGKTQAEAAKLMDWVPQQLSDRLVRNSLRADEFFKLLDILGIDFHMTVRETGQPVWPKSPRRRVKGMAKKVIYDTALSGSVSNNFYADGVNEYDRYGVATELFIDREGRYFFVDYYRDDPSKDEIRVMPMSCVEDFIKKYGTQVDRSPKN